MKQYSIRQHVAWLTLTPLLFMAVSLETYFLQDRFFELDRYLVERGQLIARQLAIGSEYGVFSDNREFLQNLAQGVLQQEDVEGVLILDAQSGVLVVSGKFFGMEEHNADNPNFPVMDANRMAYARIDKIKESVSLQEPLYRNDKGVRIYIPVVSTQLLLDDLSVTSPPRQLGAVIVEMSNARTGQQKSQMLLLTVGSTLLFLIFPLCLIYLASRNIVLPIHKLSDAVKALGNGQLDTRVSVANHVSELVTLAGGINDMAEKLQQENAILQRNVDDAVRIAAIAFESHEGMMITDPALMIIRVNKAFTRISGYTEEDAVGQTPHQLLSSGQHDDDFYAAMWDSIEATGLWQGEIVNRRKSGETYPAWVNITAVTREDGNVAFYVATYADITVRKAAENEIKNLAFNDELTQLPNRRMLIDRLNNTMAISKRSRRYSALMFIDLDNFKPLNDQYGHEIGDLLLMEVAQRLLNCVREVDTVARFGGDEFVVMLSELDIDKQASILQAGIVAEKIRAILAEPYLLPISKEGKISTTVKHHCSSSIGVQLFIGHEYSAEEVLNHADLAMYRAKRDGRNLVRFHDSQ